MALDLVMSHTGPALGSEPINFAHLGTVESATKVAFCFHCRSDSATLLPFVTTLANPEVAVLFPPHAGEATNVNTLSLGLYFSLLVTCS